MKISGIDGCKAGWVAVCEIEGQLQVHLWPDISPLFQSDWDMVMIDILIGLLDSERRPCDQAAREILGPKRSSVFYSPTRSQVSAQSYEEVRVQGVDVRIVRVEGSQFTHVRVGRFADRSTAIGVLESLAEQGIRAALVRDERAERPAGS